jgi:anti-sigma regulatory factor (Ser/Thr protein kinase)
MRCPIHGHRAHDEHAGRRAAAAPCIRRSGAMSGAVNPLRLMLLPQASSLSTVRASFRPWLQSVGAAHTEDIVLAVNEAVANAVEHAGLDADDAITIEAEVVEDVLRILVRDNGSWRDAHPGETRGRGLLIIRALMDQVDLKSRAEGTVVKMSRHLR